jgi:hypothetical protein
MCVPAWQALLFCQYWNDLPTHYKEDPTSPHQKQQEQHAEHAISHVGLSPASSAV